MMPASAKRPPAAVMTASAWRSAWGDSVAVDVEEVGAGLGDGVSDRPRHVEGPGRHQHAEQDVGLVDQDGQAGGVLDAGGRGQGAGALAAAAEVGDDAGAVPNQDTSDGVTHVAGAEQADGRCGHGVLLCCGWAWGGG
jgi:hypothetical protein